MIRKDLTQAEMKLLLKQLAEDCSKCLSYKAMRRYKELEKVQSQMASYEEIMVILDYIKKLESKCSSIL